MALCSILVPTVVTPPPAGAEPIDTSDRAQVADAYLDRLLPALEQPVGWTGDLDSCDAGTESTASRAATLAAVNFYRELAGLHPVSFDGTFSAKAQEAALIVAANADEGLSHEPPPDWDCVGDHPGGVEAAGRSNLALGASAARAVRLYMLEPAPATDPDGNADVGHRRALLDPAIDQMGSGSTETSNALWVRDPTPVPAPDGLTWLRWPPAGHVPWSVIPTAGETLFRFSLGRVVPHQARYDGASVEVILDGEPLDVTIDHDGASPGDARVLVFSARRHGGQPLPSGEATIDVTVSGIQLGTDTVEHSWTVHAFELAPPGTPGSVRLHRDGGRLTLRWAPAPANGAPVTGYEVLVVGRDGSGRDVTLVDRQVAASARSVSVHGLSPGGFYLGQVRALSRAGEGPVATSDPLGVPPSAPFVDVLQGTYYDRAVAWLHLTGITTGCTPSRYCPHEPVSRAQMAAFLWRFEGEPVALAPHGFTDVPNGTYFDAAVDWLKVEGLTTGCTPRRYCPHERLTRAQMAAFLWRLAGEPAAALDAAYGDVRPDSYFARAVAWMDDEGLTTGCTPSRYCPHEPVTRAQMAAFLWRLAGQP